MDFAPNMGEAAQNMFNAGPNQWVPTGNTPPDGQFVQRGLSGNYAVGTSGVPEATGVLSGNTGTGQNFVSVLDPANSPAVTGDVTSMYNNPMGVQAQLPENAIAENYGDAALTTRPIQSSEVTGIGAFAPTGGSNSDTAGWARNYLDLQSQTGITPEAGSRGEQFTSDLNDAFGTAQYGEHDGIGRPLLNADEVHQNVADVANDYGPDGSHPPATDPPAADQTNCPTCKPAPAQDPAPPAEAPKELPSNPIPWGLAARVLGLGSGVGTFLGAMFYSSPAY